MKTVQRNLRTERMATPESLAADRIIAIFVIFAVLAVIFTS